MSLVEGYKIPFHEIPQEKNILNSRKLSQEEKILGQKETHEMMSKKAIGSGGGIYQQSFSRREKKMGEPTSNKLKTPESVHTLPALQCGGFSLSSKHTKERRLYV